MGLSQNALAQMVGLKRRSIMAYENNTISPTLETAYKICKVFDKDIKEVFIFKQEILWDYYLTQVMRWTKK